MHSIVFFHALMVLGFILVSASSPNLEPSSDIADSPTTRGAMRFEYKRKGFTDAIPVRAPAAAPAVAPYHPLLQCHGNLPPPQTFGNEQTPAFASLLDWCLRGPAQCTCFYQATSQLYDVRCAMDDQLLDMVPGIVACHNQCDCGHPTDRARLESLANAALLLGRVRAGVARVGVVRN